MPFNEDSTANLFSVDNLILPGFRVHMDGDIENCVFVEKNDIVRKFIASDGGLCFHDLWNDDLCFEKTNNNFPINNNIFMQSQKENCE